MAEPSELYDDERPEDKWDLDGDNFDIGMGEYVEKWHPLPEGA